MIRYLVLEGNLDGIPVDTYARAVRDALAAAFPAEEVLVEVRRNTSGDPGEVDPEVRRIAERVWDELCNGGGA